MDELLVKELKINGLSCEKNKVISSDNKIISPKECIKIYKIKSKKYYDLTISLLNEFCKLNFNLNNKYIIDDSLYNIFLFSIKNLKSIILQNKRFECYKSALSYLDRILCTDAVYFSSGFMKKIIEYKISIEWLLHLEKKNLYIMSLLYDFYSIKPKNIQSAGGKGVHGPFANLDLPMQERVFDWSELDEQFRGDSKVRRHQRRYWMGLENYHDERVGEGFFWRELRNEPYLWGKEGENPYPHRNLLWK